MSTTVGNGLTVDGTVKASQATQAGEAVVLGDDGLIPASLVASGGGKVITEYTTYGDFYIALRTLPIGSEIYFYSRFGTGISVLYMIYTGSLPYPVISGTLAGNNSDTKSVIAHMVVDTTGNSMKFLVQDPSTNTLSLKTIAAGPSTSSLSFYKAIIITEGS